MTRSAATKLSTAALMASLSAVSIGAITVPTVKFTDSKLKNGLRVIISEDHTAPVFSVAVTYNVGSRDERIGRTGFAHLFEHMMFKGSENVGPGEHFYTIFSNGGTMNGTTNKERTLYFETMPANQLDAALFLEADRMRSLAIVKENLDNQRNAVQEERRLRVDNQPYGLADEEIEELAFDNFAYQHSVIGSMQDLNAASVEDVAAFFTHLLRAQQRHHRHRRRRQHRVGTRPRAKILRVDSVAGATTAGRRQPAAARQGTPAAGRRFARAATQARHRLPRPFEPVARRRCSRCSRRDPGQRPQRPALRAPRPRKAARGVGAGVRAETAAVPGCSESRPRRHRAHRSISSSRRSIPRSRA